MRTLRVRWVVEQPEFSAGETPLDYLRSMRASRRLRIALPARTFAAAGAVQDLGFIQGGPAAGEGATPDVAVFSKLIESSDDGRIERAAVHAASALRARGARIVLDVCDNLAIHPALGPMRALIELADRVVVATPALADAVHDAARRSLSRLPEVISDPVEGARAAAVFHPPRRPLLKRLLARADVVRPLRLLWFGGPARNFLPLEAWLPRLADWARRHPAELVVMTGPWPEVLRAVESRAAGAPGLRLRHEPWSASALAVALAACDLVVLPDAPRDPLRIGASANRLIESLWGGRFVIATGVPSYLEFRDEAWIGEDLIAGLDWALSHPAEVVRRIARGQERIAAGHSPERIGVRWFDLLREVAAG